MSSLADRLSQQQLSFLFCVLLNFELTGDIYCRCTEFDILVCWTSGMILWHEIYEGYRFLLVPVYHKKYWSKSIRIAIGNTFWNKYWYCQYFQKVLLTTLLLIMCLYINKHFLNVKAKKYLSDEAGGNRNIKVFFLIKIHYGIIFALAYANTSILYFTI